jgi:hypothetical protein
MIGGCSHSTAITMESEQQERIFYQDEKVTVTQSRFISYNKTYAMRNISSVALSKLEKSRAYPIILIILGIFLIFTGGTIQLIGVGVAAIGVIWILLMKDEYSVRISTNAGELDSLISEDYSYVEKVVNALNEAMIHRG